MHRLITPKALQLGVHPTSPAPVDQPQGNRARAGDGRYEKYSSAFIGYNIVHHPGHTREEEFQLRMQEITEPLEPLFHSAESGDEDDTCASTPSSPSFLTTPARRRLTHDVRLKMHQIHMHGVSLVELAFEPKTLRSRDFTTRPLRPQDERAERNKILSLKRHLH
ncbi:hypothetical protein AVEN_44823-1 [Araneus ventricosus]|uniref:Uncharacterized protein n=1 Tax=Araneus ventricosus TaxID=182803 RepID=A0A4Y2CK08_ARAVE|nr:hypothetical protein AVEN_44823-1 [Araneus ventricosus]